MANEEIKPLLPAEYRLMFGDTSAKMRKAPTKKRDNPEGKIQKAVLGFLKMHKEVAWAERMNTGAMKVQGRYGSKDRYLRFGFPGCSDIIGQMKDGRFLAVEVKAGKNKPSDAQWAFMNKVNNNGGVAGPAWSIDDVVELFKEAGY